MDSADLHEQLRRLGLRRGAEGVTAPARSRQRAIERLLPGEVRDTRHGPFFLYRQTFDLDYRHGQRTLSELLAQSPADAARLARDDRLAGVDFRRLAFLDTETTGLAGGTGTYAFLVGVGLFEAEEFVLYQFFMRDYGEEPAQLHALGELLDRVDAVVTFNGKSFDLPLLETRFILARQLPRLSGAPHLDLLPPARRFWKHRLESCALSSLEVEILGVQRTEDDVPGWLIPRLYTDYARTGDAGDMPRIFYHNAQDILSLVTLLAHQCRLLSLRLTSGQALGTTPGQALPLPLHGRPVTVPGEDLYGLGRLWEDLGDPARAEGAYALAAETSSLAAVRERAMRDLAHLLKRQERRAEALRWWRQLAETFNAVYACEELAMHYEWHDVDLNHALTWTQQGLGLAGTWPAGRKRREALAELHHRLDRLQLKWEAQDAASARSGEAL